METDYLNEEICRLGRMHGIPTPVNKAIQILTSRAIKQG
ncbi:MAG: ketopantoate reductase C-terminal domain-containing protein [Candidatus Azotimanducaceae bacterium]